MIEAFYKVPDATDVFRKGPFADHIEGFAEVISSQGYDSQYARRQLHLVAELGRWLEYQGRAIAHLDEEVLRQFLYERRNQKCSRPGDPTTLQNLLSHLRLKEVVPPSAHPDDHRGAAHRLLREFGRYLDEECGMTENTLRTYQRVARAFLWERFPAAPVRVDDLRPVDVTRFVLRHTRARASVARQMMPGLRSFLRFLRQRAHAPRDLAAAVPTVASWRLARLPRCLPADTVEKLVRSCDRRTWVGRRDFAILLLLARLGVRAHEVVALKLDDIQWARAELVVRSKGREDRLPLPSDVGRALAGYLRRCRPQCAAREVFVRARPPHRAFGSSSAICAIVDKALTRAGISPAFRGSHLFRHSLATTMLSKGASLVQIGQVLRHRHPDTTAIYAKVDVDALRRIAPGWPGGRP